MNRRLFAIALSATLSAAAVAQSPPEGSSRQPRHTVYEATQNGVRTELALQVDGTRFDGTITENGLRLTIHGQLQGRLLTGLLAAGPASGRVFLPLTGELAGDSLQLNLRLPDGVPQRLSLHRVGAASASSAPTNSAAPSGATLDPRLVGRWHRQTMTSSGGGAGGFASFSTERTLLLSPDGQLQQRVRSAGGGSQWSTSSPEKVEFAGRWATTAGGALWVQLADQGGGFQRAASYRFVDQRLIIEDGRGRQIWER